MLSKTSLLSLSIASIALGACGSVAPSPSAFQARAPITAIQTTESEGLRCLGRLIDASSRGPVEVAVGQIRDRTVPRRFEDRRLSKGGEWWVHTAVAKMNTPKVSSLDRGDDDRVGARTLVFEGAWTQDDRVGVEGSSEFSAVLGNAAFSLFGDVDYDLIAGDFTSVQNGRVTYASAVGAVISAGSGDAEFFIRDGRDSYAFAFGGGVIEGPQMAQRQITEAALAAHLASYFQVDYRSCFVSQVISTASFNELSPRDRNLALQRNLKTLGHYEGAIDGIWGPQSSAALRRFATDADLPASDRPTEALFLAAREAAAR